MIAVGIPLPLMPLKATDIYELKRGSSTTSLGSRQLMRKRNIHAFDAVDGSSHRHRERLLAVPSGLIEQHDGVGVLREARGGAIEGYVHDVGIDLGEDEREAQKLRASVVIQAAASRMRRAFITLRKPDESIEHDSNDQEPKLYE